jgi:hypothetical protein
MQDCWRACGESFSAWIHAGMHRFGAIEGCCWSSRNHREKSVRALSLGAYFEQASFRVPRQKALTRAELGNASLATKLNAFPKPDTLFSH